MTDPIDFSQWARQWEGALRDFMAKLPAAGSTHPFAMPSWNAGATSTAQGEAIERMVAGAQGYLGLLQSLVTSASGQPGGHAGGMPPWLGAFGSGAGVAPGAAPWFAHPFGEALRGFGTQGAAGFEQMMERFSAAAGPMLENARGSLDLPAFGFLREHQEEAQAGARALLDYQEQMARYNRLMLKVGEQGFARFQLKLAEREEPGRQIESVRGLYDLWIDAVEEAYAGIALSEEFRETYGALVNAQMRVREHVQRRVERFSNEVGVPTRSEVDSIGERLQALRREFRAEREAVGDVAALSAEVDALRAEVAALHAAAAPSNVVAFGRPARAPAEAPKAATAAKPRRRSAPRKAKSMPQVARAVSRSTAAETKPPATARPKPPSAKRAKPARATRRKAAPAAPAEVVESPAGKRSFAARMARFARANAGAAAPSKLKSKPAKR